MLLFPAVGVMHTQQFRSLNSAFCLYQSTGVRSPAHASTKVCDAGNMFILLLQTIYSLHLHAATCSLFTLNHHIRYFSRTLYITVYKLIELLLNAAIISKLLFKRTIQCMCLHSPNQGESDSGQTERKV